MVRPIELKRRALCRSPAGSVSSLTTQGLDTRGKEMSVRGVAGVPRGTAASLRSGLAGAASASGASEGA